MVRPYRVPGAGPSAPLTTRAPAKVNLTLHVLGRRADGYHDLESLVMFAGAADHLTLVPGGELTLHVAGATAEQAGPLDDNLVIRAARALAERLPSLRLGAFRLTKTLPAAAGIGGGSSDAAAALRLLARANGLPLSDPRLRSAATATGADVLVCLEPTARMMRGAGEAVGPPLGLPPLFAVLINPRVAVPTPAVFRGLVLAPGTSQIDRAHPALGTAGDVVDVAALLDLLARARNDLEPPALALAPIIGDALALLRGSPRCRLARMSGSGATVFGIYDDGHTAALAARVLRQARPNWWIRPTLLR